MKKIFLSFLIVLGLTGCAVSSHYVKYTDKKFLPKSKDMRVAIYPDSEKVTINKPYYVIGRVDLSGYASDFVTPERLRQKAQAIARKKGADAIIHALNDSSSYGGVYVRGGYFGRHYYHPARAVPYGDTVFMFSGDLIVFSDSAPK